MTWSRRGWLRQAFGHGLWFVPAVGSWAQTGPRESGAAESGRPGQRVVMAVEQPQHFCQLPLTVAHRLGFFAAEGLSLVLQPVTGPEAALGLLNSGQAQVAAGSFLSVLKAQSRGVPLQAFVLQGRSPQVVMGVSRRLLGQFGDVHDLRGRRLGCGPVGSASHRVAQFMLARAGVGGHEVQWVTMEGLGSAVELFRAGQVDAVCYHDPAVTRLEQEGDLRVVADTRTVRGSHEALGGPLPTGCLMASADWLAQPPNGVAQRLAHGLVHGLKWLQTAGPSDLIRAVPEPYFQGDRALYLAAFMRAREGWSPDGLMPLEGPSTWLRWLSQLADGQAIARLDPERTYTNDYARRAKQRFRA